MSIASEITRLSSAKAALKDAIVAKGVEIADSLKLDSYAEKVAAIPTGGIEEGTDEAPLGGWVDDGNSYFWVVVEDNQSVKAYFEATSGIEIDWGDGSPTTTTTTTKAKPEQMLMTHTYANRGMYRISISSIEDGSYFKPGIISLYGFGGYSRAPDRGYVDQDCYRYAELGGNCKWGTGTLLTNAWCGMSLLQRLRALKLDVGIESLTGNEFFLSLSNLRTISWGSGIREIRTQFAVPRIKELVFPDGITAITGTFTGCNNVEKIAIPSSVTTLGSQQFMGCGLCREVYIGAGVVEIPGLEFYNCVSLEKVTLDNPNGVGMNNSNGFYNMPSNCKIYIRKGTMDYYRSVPNWATYLTKMIEMDY